MSGTVRAITKKEWYSQTGRKECDTNLTNLSIGGISSVCPVHWPSLAPSRGRVEQALETRLRQKYQ